MHPCLRKATLVCSLLALVGAQPAFADSPLFHHHHAGVDGEEQDHWRDDGEKPARVQVGKAIFQSRALIGKDGVTDVEVTTGAFDSTATPPGNLTEVHIKAYRLNGRPQFSREFEHLKSGGYARFSFPLAAPPKRHHERGEDEDRSDRDEDRDEGKRDTSLQHGQVLRLKIEARGVGSGDEDEAEARLEETVKYRPDLAASTLQLPDKARVGTGVDMSASVVEQMMDTGAHADCVLSVDGLQVDKAAGIWVPPNGAVTCHFFYTFATPGKHAVTVSLQNIIPADYDSDNDSLSGTIQIENPSLMSYVATVNEVRLDTQSLTEVFIASNTSTTPDKRDAKNSTRDSQTRTLNGTIPAAVNLPVKKMSYADQTDGTALSALNYTDVPADFTQALVGDPNYDSMSLIIRFDRGSGGFFTVRRFANSAAGTGVTTLNVNFFGGEVTFHSDGYCHSVVGVFSCSSGDYSTNAGGPFGAKMVKLGQNYAADVMVDDGTPYQGHPAMPLQTIVTTSGVPRSCTPMTVNGASSNVCSQSSVTNTVIRGGVSYTP